MDSQPSLSSSSGRSPAESPTTTPLSRKSSTSAADVTIQNLSSVLNNPHAASSDATWLPWPSSSLSPPDFSPLPLRPSLLSRSDFLPYLSAISDPYNRFSDIQNHSQNSENSSNLDTIGGQGEALVACLREVPALYFKEDFELEDGATFRAACPFRSVGENLVLQEKLSMYLDVVELHLVKEISLRSNSFFEAQGMLQDLNVEIVEGCGRIRGLKEAVRVLDVDIVESARQIQELNSTRRNLLVLQQKLRLILYVNQAVSALKLASPLMLNLGL